jgi:hypothetical protein
MAPIELKPVRGKIVLLLLGSLVFVLLGFWFCRSQEPAAEAGSFPWFPKIVGIFSILFFGACAVEAIRQMLDTRPRLILDDRGIFDRTLSTPVIPWGSLLGAKIVQVRKTKFIALQLADEEARYAALSPIKRMMSNANQGLGCSRFNLNLSALDISAEHVLTVIEEQLELRRSPTSNRLY